MFGSAFVTLLILTLIAGVAPDDDSPRTAPSPTDVAAPTEDASKWPKNVRVATLSIHPDRYQIVERDAHRLYSSPPPIASVVPMSRLAEFLTRNVKGSIQKLQFSSMPTDNGTYVGSEQWFFALLSAVPRKLFSRLGELHVNGAFTELNGSAVRLIFNRLLTRAHSVQLIDFHLPAGGNLSAKAFMSLRVIREAHHLELRGDEQENVNFTIDSKSMVRWAKTMTPGQKWAISRGGDEDVKHLELIDEYLKDGIDKLLRVANEDFRAAKKKFTYKITVHCHETDGIVPKEAQAFGFEFNALGEELAVETFDHGHNPAFQIQRTDALGEGGDGVKHDEL